MPGWLRKRRRPETSDRAPHPLPVGHAQVATVADISACFRLLLGREPNREEWTGHAARSGEALPIVVASFLNSLEFARRGLMDLDRQGEIALTELADFRIYTARGDAAVGDHVREGGVYEPEVTAAIRRLLKPGMGFIDLGANIGFFSLLAASLVGPEGWVLAMEPNPRNVKLLEASRRANGFDQLTVCQLAAGRTSGLLMLNTSFSNGTTSRLPDGTNALFGAELVPCIRTDSLVSRDRCVDVIKVDVEGAEYSALLGCRDVIARDRPRIVTEFSPHLMPGISGISGLDYLAWLQGLGYSISVIRPDGSTGPAMTVEAVMIEYEARGTDHLDLLAVANGVS